MKHTFLFLSLISVLLNAQEGKVGINTDNPQSTLHVNGNMNIRKLGEYVKESTTLTWNPNTHNIAKGKSFNKLRTFTFAMKTIKKNSNYGQPYGDLNTKVSTDKYELYITNWTFDNERNRIIDNYDSKVGVNHVRWSGKILNPIPIIEAYEGNDGNWHIKARYACTKNKDDYGPIEWTIETMILPRGFAKHIDIPKTSVTENPNNGWKPQGSLDSNPLGDAIPLTENNEVVNYIPGYPNKGVGIEKENPSATLDINGKLAINEVKVPSEKGLFLYRKNATGELIEAPIKDKPIFNVNFYVPTDINAQNNNDRDRVNFFDTRIPKDKFYIIINNVIYGSANHVGTESIYNVGVTHETTGGRNYNPSKMAVVTEFKPDGTKNATWGLRLDYVNAGPGKTWQDNHPGQFTAWYVNALVISNEFMKDINNDNLLPEGYLKEAIIDNDGNATAEPLNGLD